MRRSRRDDEAYAAFKKRLEAVQHVEYATLSYSQEQRRLRAHLRRIVLEHDGPFNPLEFVSRFRKHYPTDNQLTTWKSAAMSVDDGLRKRYAAVCMIQRTVRKWITTRGERELPSSSEFVDILPLSKLSNPITKSVPTQPEECKVFGSDAGVISEPYQVVVELLGARDLPSTGRKLHHADADCLLTTVQVVHMVQHNVLGSRAAPLVPLVHALADGIQWDDQVLQVGIDPGSLPVLKVVEECSVVVNVSLTDAMHSRSCPLGQVVIALDLLETPLAEKYAMTRWFPIERVPGRGFGLVKGEVHVSVRVLMRNPVLPTSEFEPDIWIPFQGGSSLVRCLEAKDQRTSKQASKLSVIAVTSRKQSLSSPSKAQRYPQQEQSSQNRRGSPIHRARMEAMSPPSSPSSYSSDSNTIESDRSPQKIATPRKPSYLIRRSSRGNLPQEPSRKRSSLQASPTRPVSETRLRDGDAPTVNATKESPKKPFLKRKPYKVVFQKLDWSKVGSKTDSNLGTSNPSGKSSPQCANKAHAKELSSSGTHSTAMTSKYARLSTVVTEVHSACLVTPQFASLAQMKYRNERSRLIAHGLHEETLRALWTELQMDLNGARYVELLSQAELKYAT